MPWLILIVAGLFETCWAITLKLSNGFTRPWPAAVTVIAMVASVVLLGIAMKHIPLGTAYAAWTGIGAVGTVILGIFLFHDPASAARLVCLGLIVAGIVGLKLVSPD